MEDQLNGGAHAAVPPANAEASVSVGASYEQQRQQPHPLDQCNGRQHVQNRDHVACVREEKYYYIKNETCYHIIFYDYFGSLLTVIVRDLILLHDNDFSGRVNLYYVHVIKLILFSTAQLV